MGSEDVTITPSGRAPERIGRFRILEPLGAGGMGVVFKAYDEERRDIVALKLVQPDPLATNAGQFERFRREGASLQKLTHPNIVPVVATGEADGYAYIALELIDGGALSSVDLRTLEDRRKLEIGRDVAHALAYAHQHGVVHRDVKPSNILLRRDGVAVLTDFGLARDESRLTRLTQSIALLGTPAYMSPEQAEGVSRRIDSRTDIYSLGVVLYEMFSGRVPFDAPDVESLITRIREEEPPPLRTVAPATPPDLAAVVARAMRREAEERYPSAEALADDLDRLIRGERPVGAGVPIGRRLRGIARRRRGLLAACGCALLLGGVLGLMRKDRGPTAESRRLAAADAIHAIFEREAKPLPLIDAKLDDKPRITAALAEMTGGIGEKPDMDDIRGDVSTELQGQMLASGVATIFDRDLKVFVSRGPRDDQESLVPVWRPTGETPHAGVVITFPRAGQAWIVALAPLHAPGGDEEVGWAAVGTPFPLAEATKALAALGAAARWRNAVQEGVTFGDPALARHLAGPDVPPVFEESGQRYQTFEATRAACTSIIAVASPVRPGWVLPLAIAGCAAGVSLLLLSLIAGRKA